VARPAGKRDRVDVTTPYDTAESELRRKAGRRGRAWELLERWIKSFLKNETEEGG